jgi:hypothetical protein
MKFERFCLSASALGLLLAPIQAANAQTAAEKPGSAYVQCDGQPNNVTAGETAARLVGAVTLLGLFAPPPEAPDASKRKFGAAGVAVCTSLLAGGSQEGNPGRRLGLYLARAIHQIEDKKYAAAIADVGLARHEADAAGLSSDAYFGRSRGRAFDLIESAALLRMGRTDEARAISLRKSNAVEYSLFGLLSAPTYENLIAQPSEASDRIDSWRSRIAPMFASFRADHLEIAGRFADAARVRDAVVEFDTENSPELNSSVALARAAVTQALAGNDAAAVERAKSARANADKRKADGKPESDASEFVELMDLYSIIESARAGDLKTARRLFSGRSQWVGASLGSVMEVNRRLRQGASPDELIGGLARTSEQLWSEHVEADRAAMLAKDSDNKALFQLIPGLRAAGSYEALSKNVWRTDKSKIVIKKKVDPAKSPMELMFLPMADPAVAMDGYVLHAALLARTRGHQGFVFFPVLTDKYIAAAFRTGNRGQKGLPDVFFIDANDAIAKLGPIIPDPERLQALRANR